MAAKQDAMYEKYMIRNVILEMDKPFKMSELFAVLREKDIINKWLILSILEQLMNCGLVTTSDVEDDMAIYRSVFASTASCM